MIYTVRTERSIETIKTQLPEHAKEAGFGVLGQYDFKQILASKGFPIERDITVYELCAPSAAQSALATLPEISVYLPCRLSIYEENGQSVLATIGIEDMLNSIDTDEEFKVHMMEIFTKIKGVMDSW